MDAEKKSALKSNIVDWIKFFMILSLSCIILTNCIGLTKVMGYSMNPSLEDGSFLLIDKASTHLKDPKYGDVVIVQQEGKGYQIVKRVIATEGDVVSIKDGTVYVNQSPLPEIYKQGKSDDMNEVKIEKGTIFIMGDNRTPGESLDSRDASVGPLPISSIRGYAIVSVFPAYKIMKPLKL